jgi:hypothetical protein
MIPGLGTRSWGAVYRQASILAKAGRQFALKDVTKIFATGSAPRLWSEDESNTLKKLPDAFIRRIGDSGGTSLGAYAQRDQLCDIPGLKTRTWYAVAKKIGKLISARRMRKMTLRNPQAKSMLPAPKEKPARHKQPWLLEEDQAIYALIKERAEFPSRVRSYDHSETRLGHQWCTIQAAAGARARRGIKFVVLWSR